MHANMLHTPSLSSQVASKLRLRAMPESPRVRAFVKLNGAAWRPSSTQVEAEAVVMVTTVEVELTNSSSH